MQAKNADTELNSHPTNPERLMAIVMLRLYELTQAKPQTIVQEVVLKKMLNEAMDHALAAPKELLAAA